jgi:hypothetical protein
MPVERCIIFNEGLGLIKQLGAGGLFSIFCNSGGKAKF